MGRVFVANPLQVRVIAAAKTKTDRVDAAHWPGCTRLATCRWRRSDEATEMLRFLVSRRALMVPGPAAPNNRIYAVLHADLMPPSSMAASASWGARICAGFWCGCDHGHRDQDLRRRRWYALCKVSGALVTAG